MKIQIDWINLGLYAILALVGIALFDGTIRQGLGILFIAFAANIEFVKFMEIK